MKIKKNHHVSFPPCSSFLFPFVPFIVVGACFFFASLKLLIRLKPTNINPRHNKKRRSRHLHHTTEDLKFRKTTRDDIGSESSSDRISR